MKFSLTKCIFILLKFTSHSLQIMSFQTYYKNEKKRERKAEDFRSFKGKNSTLYFHSTLTQAQESRENCIFFLPFNRVIQENGKKCWIFFLAKCSEYSHFLLFSIILTHKTSTSHRKSRTLCENAENIIFHLRKTRRFCLVV